MRKWRRRVQRGGRGPPRYPGKGSMRCQDLRDLEMGSCGSSQVGRGPRRSIVCARGEERSGEDGGRGRRGPVGTSGRLQHRRPERSEAPRGLQRERPCPLLHGGLPPSRTAFVVVCEGPQETSTLGVKAGLLNMALGGRMEALPSGCQPVRKTAPAQQVGHGAGSQPLRGKGNCPLPPSPPTLK